MKICIFYSSPKLGDLILQLPFFKAVAKYYNTKVSICVNQHISIKEILEKQDYIEEVIRRVPLRDGSKVIDFAKYRKTKNPKIKELKLSDVFTPETTLAELDDNQRATLNTLLRLTFGKKD